MSILLFVRFGLAITIHGAKERFDATTNTWPARLNINTLNTSGPAWDLFVLALQDMQDDHYSNPMSYFQISAIHGWPVQPWDNVTGPGNASTGGFCRHESTLFPIWHRPYLALFEV